MAKRQRKVSKRGHNYDAVESLDDNLLPSARELVEYQKVDSDLVPFLKKRAEIEQEKRHDFNDEIIKLNRREQILTHGLNYAALACGFFIVMGAMAMSYMLIIKNFVVLGSIFGGVGLMYVAYLFISVINRGATPPKQ